MSRIRCSFFAAGSLASSGRFNPAGRLAPSLRRLLLLWLLPAAAFAQEVYIPDITTVISGGGLEVAEEALPDYSASIPQRPPALPETPPPAQESAEPVLEPLPPSVVALAASSSRQNLFMEGLVAPSWPLGLDSRFKVYTAGEAPFLLDFAYNVAGGYGLETAEEGFFRNKSLLSVGKTFLPGIARLHIAGTYQSMDNGLQGHSLLFDDINRRGAGVQVDMDLPLSHGFSLSAGLPLGWYSRYAGFSSTVGRTRVNRGVAVSILQLSPRLKVNWSGSPFQNAAGGPASQDGGHLFDLGLNLGWDHTASLDPEVALSQNRISLGLSAAWLWKAALKVQGALALVYFPAGSGADDVRLVLPFSLGMEWSRSGVQGDLKLFARGGLESRQVSYLELEQREAFVNLLAKSLLKNGEQSDWFFSTGAKLPLASHLGLDLTADFKKSALGNNVLTGDYSSGINSDTGLFAGVFVDRTRFATQAAVTMELSSFLMKAGWKGNWLYVPAYLPPHNIFLSLGYESPARRSAGSIRWGGEVKADFGIHGPDNVPELKAMAYFKPVENLRLALELKDMIKLFSGSQRVLVEPYVKDSGSVSLSLQFSF